MTAIAKLTIAVDSGWQTAFGAALNKLSDRATSVIVDKDDLQPDLREFGTALAALALINSS